MEMADRHLHILLPEQSIQKSTTYHGKEFSCYPTLEMNLVTEVYFAGAYSSWQCRSNDNGNVLLREFLPKQINFDHFTEEEMNRALNLINNRPKSALSGKLNSRHFRKSCCA